MIARACVLALAALLSLASTSRVGPFVKNVSFQGNVMVLTKCSLEYTNFFVSNISEVDCHEDRVEVDVLQPSGPPGWSALPAARDPVGVVQGLVPALACVERGALRAGLDVHLVLDADGSVAAVATHPAQPGFERCAHVALRDAPAGASGHPAHIRVHVRADVAAGTPQPAGNMPLQ